MSGVATRRFLVGAQVTLNRTTAEEVARADWGEYLYHQLPLAHALSVLKSGFLLSRDSAKAEGLITHDAASASVIAQSQRLAPFARLYFRPRTPTHFRWEGIKPADDTGPYCDVHCPMPFTLRFAARPVLSMQDVLFTASSPARPDVDLISDPRKLAGIDWRLVYHDHAMPQDPVKKRDIVGARGAEVLVPDKLTTSYLHSIVARSPAERDTLVGRMTEDIWERWADRVIVNTSKTRCYHESRVFVDTVAMHGSSITVRFGGSATRLRTYDVSFRGRPRGANTWLPWRTVPYTLSSTLQIDAISLDNGLRLQIKIEGHLAFDGLLHGRTIY